MDYNKLFQQDAFKAINPHILERFKVLIKNIKGKDNNQIIIEIMNFYNNIPKDVKLSKEESNALIQAIVLNMPEEEREKFIKMLDLISNFI